MADIALTKIGTSDDASLCKGLALFPIGNPNAGIKAGDGGSVLFDFGANLLIFQFSAKAEVGFTLGVCGPGYGFNFMASGRTSGNSLELNIGQDLMNAGFFFGFNFHVGVHVGINRLAIDWVWDGWHSGIRTSWESLFEISLGIDIDLIALILDFIQYAMKEQNVGQPGIVEKIGTFTPTLLGSYGMMDTTSNQLAASGSMTAHPGTAVPIDIGSLIPELRAVNKALNILGGGVSFGPIIAIAIPVTARISKVQLSNAQRTVSYPNPTVSNGKLTATTSDEPITDPKTISVEMTHHTDFELSLGVFASVVALKIFSVGFTTTFSLLSVLNLSITGHDFTNTVPATIGQGSIGRGVGGVAQAEKTTLTEVILMPPGYVPA